MQLSFGNKELVIKGYYSGNNDVTLYCGDRIELLL